jgi:hypothetical protein
MADKFAREVLHVLGDFDLLDKKRDKTVFDVSGLQSVFVCIESPKRLLLLDDDVFADIIGKKLLELYAISFQFCFVHADSKIIRNGAIVNAIAYALF